MERTQKQPTDNTKVNTAGSRLGRGDRKSEMERQQDNCGTGSDLMGHAHQVLSTRVRENKILQFCLGVRRRLGRSLTQPYQQLRAFFPHVRRPRCGFEPVPWGCAWGVSMRLASIHLTHRALLRQGTACQGRSCKWKCWCVKHRMGIFLVLTPCLVLCRLAFSSPAVPLRIRPSQCLVQGMDGSGRARWVSGPFSCFVRPGK